MSPRHPARHSPARLTALIGIIGALVVWPLGSHWVWRSGEPALHGIPAFFLGWLLVVLLGGIIRGLTSAWSSGGWRWSLTRPAARLYLTTLALAASVVVLFYTVELWRGERAYARVSRLAQQLGEPLDLQALKPNPIPDEQNFAKTPALRPLEDLPDSPSSQPGRFTPANLGLLDDWARRALEFMQTPPPSPPWMQGQFCDLETGRTSATHRSEAAERILNGQSPWTGLLNEVSQASRRPACQFAWSNVNPLFSQRAAYTDKVLIGLLLVLEQRAVAELRTGQTDAAFGDLQTGLRIAAHLHRQPALFYARPRAQATSRLLQPLWEGLVGEKWTRLQLEALQEQLDSFDFLANQPDHLRFQILTHTDLIESIIPTGPTPASGLPWSDHDRSVLAWVRRLYPRGWSLQDQAALHALHFNTLKRVVAEPGSPTGPERQLVRQLIRASSDPCFAVFLIPKAIQMTRDNHEFLIFEQTVLNLARTAVALERYHLAQSDYPNSLAALVPAFWATLPTDPVKASPLGYRRNSASGYRVYSVGMDRRDDQGTLPPPTQVSGPIVPPVGWDWVWVMDRANADRE